MAGFFRQVVWPLVKEGTKQAPKAAAPVVRNVPAVARPLKEFTRAAITGAPKYAQLGANGQTVATIYASTRAGMQANALAKATAYAAVTKLPRAAVKAVKMAGRMVARDEVITPYVAPVVHGYGALRNERRLRGVSTLLERYGDKIVQATATGLNRVGLAPKLRSEIFSLSRILLFGGLYEGLRNARGALDDIEQYAKTMAREYDGLKGQLAARFNVVPPVQPAEPVPVPVAPPVVQDVRPPVVATPAPPPRPAQPPAYVPVQGGGRKVR